MTFPETPGLGGIRRATGTKLAFLAFPPMGIGVKPIITHHHLALDPRHPRRSSKLAGFRSPHALG